MKVKDVHQWSMQEQAFLQDETGKQFLHYMTFWVETAEKLIEEQPLVQDDGEDGTFLQLTPYEALNKALAVAEEEIGNMDAGAFLGQMLSFIIGNWILGEEVANQLSNIELKMVTSSLQERMAQMQAMAEENSQPKV